MHSYRVSVNQESDSGLERELQTDRKIEAAVRFSFGALSSGRGKDLSSASVRSAIFRRSLIPRIVAISEWTSPTLAWLGQDMVRSGDFFLNYYTICVIVSDSTAPNLFGRCLVLETRVLQMFMNRTQAYIICSQT